jgi:UDP-GlcNAc:undecaprenyl-phosphate/decaprenyl-phosphate GlcNAc-1-phosphate transferase
LIAATGVILFLTSFGISAGLLPLIERIARARGFVDLPGGRKDHDEPVPYGGGLAIFAAVAIPATCGLAAALAAENGSILPADIAQHLPGVLVQARQVFAILVGAAMMLFVGYVDDRAGLSPAVKLAAQVAAAICLVLADVRVTAHLPWPAAHVAATILFVVFATNAANFIDNMNGLLVGVAAIEASCFLAIAVASGQLFVAAILICLVGGLLAFLPRNFPRATLFLGDAGSLSCGFLIAAMTIACKFDVGTVSYRPVVIPLLILFVPLFDGLVVTVTRVFEGRSPFQAGQDHVSHRLTRHGFTRDHAVMYLWGLSLFAGVLALVYARVPIPVVLFTVAPTVFCLAWVARKAQ